MTGLINIILTFGITSVCFFLYNHLRSLYAVIQNLLDPGEKRNLQQRYGEWAVITGCTDGIGRGYANELARKGLKLVLISRNEMKLRQMQREIEADYCVYTKYIVADFAKGQSIYPYIKKELQGITVGILVNNVGCAYDRVERFENIPESQIWTMIYANIVAATYLTHLVIPMMKRQGKGAIINISSATDIASVPYLGIYSATKAYISNFTVGIQLELKSYKHITVQLVSPLFVRTKLINSARPLTKYIDLIIPDANTYAKSAVWTIGKTNATTGYWLHGLQYTVLKTLPRGFLEYVLTFLGKCLPRSSFQPPELPTNAKHH